MHICDIIKVSLSFSGQQPLGNGDFSALELHYSPVVHGAVTQENVNSKAIVGPDVSSSTQSVQALGREAVMNTGSTHETSPPSGP